jgi:hypothetical protein
MNIIESSRPDTEFEELKAERSYYRGILDDLTNRANLYSADAFSQLKNHIVPRDSIINTSFQLKARKKTFWFFTQDYDIGSFRGDGDMSRKIVELQGWGFFDFRVFPNISQSDRIVE